MKSIKLLSLIALVGLSFSSCKKEVVEEQINATNTVKIENLHAPGDEMDLETGEIISISDYVYFDFSTGATTSEDSDWDIAFKGTEIIVNGGVNGTKGVKGAVLVDAFADVTEVPASAVLVADTEIAHAIPTGSGNGWYNYNPANHVISPIPGRVLVFKTAEGNYAKMEVLNYYKNAPSNPNPMEDESAFYTFNFAYQSNGSTKF